MEFVVTHVIFFYVYFLFGFNLASSSSSRMPSYAPSSDDESERRQLNYIKSELRHVLEQISSSRSSISAARIRTSESRLQNVLVLYQRHLSSVSPNRRQKHIQTVEATLQRLSNLINIINSGSSSSQSQNRYRGIEVIIQNMRRISSEIQEQYQLRPSNIFSVIMPDGSISTHLAIPSSHDPCFQGMERPHCREN